MKIVRPVVQKVVAAMRRRVRLGKGMVVSFGGGCALWWAVVSVFLGVYSFKGATMVFVYGVGREWCAAAQYVLDIGKSSDCFGPSSGKLRSAPFDRLGEASSSINAISYIAS